MKFDVAMQRTEYRSHTFTVEADSRDEAEQAADEASCDFDWHDASIGSADEECVGITEVK
ncbi:MAG: hypothetical protein V3V85_04880 [Candidatus Thorarchaeota archaeon]